MPPAPCATFTVGPPLPPAVSGNRSLDEFGGAGESDENDVAREPEPDDDQADDDRPAESTTDTAVDPAPAGDGADDGVDAEADAVTASAGDADPDPDVGDSDEADGSDGDDGSAGPVDDADGPADPVVDGEPVDRPASTYRWSPDGAACATCGESVEERWRDGDDLVCAGCKEW